MMMTMKLVPVFLQILALRTLKKKKKKKKKRERERKKKERKKSVLPY